MLEKCGPYSSGPLPHLWRWCYTLLVFCRKNILPVSIKSQFLANPEPRWWAFEYFENFEHFDHFEYFEYFEYLSILSILNILSILSIFASENLTTIFSRPAAVPAKAQTLFSAVLTILIKIYRFYNWLDCKKEIAFFEFSLVMFGDKNIIKHFQYCKTFPKKRPQ